jgi:hypothetical protein
MIGISTPTRARLIALMVLAAAFHLTARGAVRASAQSYDCFCQMHVRGYHADGSLASCASTDGSENSYTGNLNVCYQHCFDWVAGARGNACPSCYPWGCTCDQSIVQSVSTGYWLFYPSGDQGFLGPFAKTCS